MMNNLKTNLAVIRGRKLVLMTLRKRQKTKRKSLKGKQNKRNLRDRDHLQDQISKRVLVPLVQWPDQNPLSQDPVNLRTKNGEPAKMSKVQVWHKKEGPVRRIRFPAPHKLHRSRVQAKRRLRDHGGSGPFGWTLWPNILNHYFHYWPKVGLIVKIHGLKLEKVNNLRKKVLVPVTDMICK